MPNESTELTYGGRKIAFVKSESIVALRARPGRDKDLEGAVRATPDFQAASTATLGGFRLYRTLPDADRTNRQLDAFRALTTVDVGSHVFHTSDDGIPFVPTGQLFVRFKGSTSSDMREQLIEENALEFVEARGATDLIVKVTKASGNPVKVAAQLQASGLVDVAEPDLASPAQLKQLISADDSLLGEQWHLLNKGKHRGTTQGFVAGADARVVAAWQAAETLGSSDVVVAVIDDGFDLGHPDLGSSDKVKAPWDFTRNSNSPVPDPLAEDWHGTACAGVAVGSANGGNILGAAPGASLMPVRWGRDLSDRQIENWFGYVAKHGASIVSCSWGAAAVRFPLSTRADEAITRCATQGRGGLGIVVVFAAGNDNRDINDPNGKTLDGFAVHSSVIAVAASTSKDKRSDYSNFGDEISVCAPSDGAGGWGILTSDVTGSHKSNGISVFSGYEDGDYTYIFGGTSSACPLVAGVCALVLTVAPTLTASEVKILIQDTARKIGKPDDYIDGHCPKFGYGCIDAESAVKAAMARP